MGDIHARRRTIPGLDPASVGSGDGLVYEVILGDEHLMSSLFTVAEIALADLGLAAVESVDGAGDDLDVVVGGLGLGYTAAAALADGRVRSVHVVDALGEVIAWHEQGLFPLSEQLTSDDRCHLVHGDFFAMVRGDAPFGAGAPTMLDAVLVDIDHTPTHLLHPSHADFYAEDGLRRLRARLRPGGVFGLWSDDRPEDGFLDVVDQVFGSSTTHDVTFANPYTGSEARNAVVVATRTH